MVSSRTAAKKPKRTTSSKEPGPRSDRDWRQKPFENPDGIVRVATVFSGIGAIEHALQRLNLRHEIVFAGDIDPNVKASYFANYSIASDRWHDDITRFDARPFKGKVDLLVGGSPCQSFSMVGDRKGLEDTRGTLFFDYARVIKECRPKLFIYENVQGLLTHDEGRTWSIMQEVFDSLGYRMESAVLNSRDFGIPQNRQRLFAIGVRDRRAKLDWPTPVPLTATMQDFLEDFTASKFYLRSKGVKFVTSSKNRSKRYTQINGSVALCQKANQQFNWHGDFVFEPQINPLEFDEFTFDVRTVEEKYYLSDAVRRYVLAGGTKTFRTSTATDLPIARPLLQSMHKMHRAGVDNYVTHAGRIRKLTPRECLRLMGFRDNFKIAVCDTQMYRQAGNSIVVDVLIALLRQIDVTRFAKAPKRNQRLRISRR